MILVATGTHEAPMRRLLSTLDALVGAGRLADELVVQSVAIVPLRHGRRVELLSYEAFASLVAAAAVVVCHAGPGTLATVRAAGKVPVVVPRDPKFGEHVDDHQLRYAARLKQNDGYLVVDRLVDLAPAIDEARNIRHNARPADVSRAVEVLESLVSSDHPPRRYR